MIVGQAFQYIRLEQNRKENHIQTCWNLNSDRDVIESYTLFFRQTLHV